jgi:hypothetical protein
VNDIYLRTPHGLVPMQYEPKRFYHFHFVEVLIFFGLGVLIGIIGSEWVITHYLPHPVVHACVKEIRNTK